MHSYQVLLTLLVILIQSLPLSSNNANLLILLPTITNIINLSMSTGVFLINSEDYSVHPLLKKSNVTKENLSNVQDNISPIVPIQTHSGTFYKSTCWQSQWEQPHDFFPVCLHQIQLYWDHFTCFTRSHYQGHESTVSHWSVNSWSFFRLWH